MVAIRYMNENQEKTIVLDRKTFIFQLFGWYLYSHCGRNRGEWCKRRCRSTSSSSTDTVDKDPCFGCKMKCRNNVKKCPDGRLATHTAASRLSSDHPAPPWTFSKAGSYSSRRISLIHLHMFAKCLIALFIRTSLGSQKAYCICIQLITAIVLHPHKTLLCPLPDLWLSQYVRFEPYMYPAFSLDTDQATSLRGTRTRARTIEWDMTAEHALSCLCDES